MSILIYPRIALIDYVDNNVHILNDSIAFINKYNNLRNDRVIGL